MTTKYKTRQLIFFCTFNFLALNIYSQWGPEFGLKTSTHMYSLISNDVIDQYEFKNGWQAGVAIRLKKNKQKKLTWIFQSEIMYSKQGYYYTWQDNRKWKLNYVNVPLLVQRYFGRTGGYVELGPQLGFPLAKRPKGNFPFKKDSGPIDASIDIGAGYIHAESGLGLSIRSAFGTNSIIKDERLLNRVYSFSLMYVFTRKKKS